MRACLRYVLHCRFEDLSADLDITYLPILQSHEELCQKNMNPHTLLQTSHPVHVVQDRQHGEEPLHVQPEDGSGAPAPPGCQGVQGRQAQRQAPVGDGRLHRRTHQHEGLGPGLHGHCEALPLPPLPDIPVFFAGALPKSAAICFFPSSFCRLNLFWP